MLELPCLCCYNRHRLCKEIHSFHTVTLHQNNLEPATVRVWRKITSSQTLHPNCSKLKFVVGMGKEGQVGRRGEDRMRRRAAEGIGSRSEKEEYTLRHTRRPGQQGTGNTSATTASSKAEQVGILTAKPLRKQEVCFSKVSVPWRATQAHTCRPRKGDYCFSGVEEQCLHSPQLTKKDFRFSVRKGHGED